MKSSKNFTAPEIVFHSNEDAYTRLKQFITHPKGKIVD